MTKKDYVAAIDLINNKFKHELTKNECQVVVKAFAAFFAQDNFRFNENLFLQECNIEI